MDAPPTGFPRELLSQPWTARLEYFKGYTMALRGWWRLATRSWAQFTKGRRTR